MQVSIVRDGKLSAVELNELLKTNHWEVSPVEKLESAITRSWCCLTARDAGGRLIGFVHVISDGILHAYIMRLIVHPDFRHQGIGSRIMTALMEILQENDLKPTLVATPGNVKFYEKFGFRTNINGLTAMCLR